MSSLAELLLRLLPAPRYEVVRQHSHTLDVPYCKHRYEWAAEWHAKRRGGRRQHRNQIGVFYDVRPIREAAK